MSSTKNTKDNRKIVRASFYIPDLDFKLPKNLDLEDKEVVEKWWVAYATLYIKYVGKEEVEKIDPCYDPTDDCYYAEPKEVVITDANDHYEEVCKDCDEQIDVDEDGVYLGSSFKCDECEDSFCADCRSFVGYTFGIMCCKCADEFGYAENEEQED